jgi:2-polyprenyl-3-methyl-5-hydroxy-6-metoxy-1,4-benzoquinol methylase
MADQGTEGLLSPMLRHMRIEKAKPYLNGKVLDIGCGSGALAKFISDENYLGIDIDETSLNIAREDYPNHRFTNTYEEASDKYDSIVALALLEHLDDPVDFLKLCSSKLSEQGHIILTTPHPKSDLIHDIGSKIGLFSSHAEEEHEELIDLEKLKQLLKRTDLCLKTYKPFQGGLNQLFVLTK